MGPPKGVPEPEFPPKLPWETFEDWDWSTLSKFSTVFAFEYWLPRGFRLRDCGEAGKLTYAFGVFPLIELRGYIPYLTNKIK
jgi:hypothetical protein